MLRLVLVRHGETDWNGGRRVQGAASDVPLNEIGRRQAECLGRALSGQGIDAIYASPQLRARETADVVARHLRLPLGVEPDLREIDAGELEGRSLDALGRGLGQFLIPDSGGEMPRLPGGEGLGQVQARAWPVIARITAGRTSGATVVVSHYFTTLAIICAALGFPLTALRGLRVAPAAISVIGFTGRGQTLLSLNDTCHLENA